MADDFVKDPNEVLDYVRDWTTALAGDTIATSAWTVPSGITKDSDSNTTTTATIWLSGGTLDADYALVNRITTAGGRTMRKTLTFRIRPK